MVWKLCKFGDNGGFLMDDFAQLLRRVRENAGIMQQELSQRTGIELSRLSRIEHGKLRPTQEEVMTLLEVIGSEESRTLAATVGHTLRHIEAPTWNTLSAEDRSALVLADQIIAKIEDASLPTSLEAHAQNLKQALIDAATFLVNPHHPICMIGHIGVGKSTAANAIFNLTEGFAKKGRRGKEAGAPGTKGLLPTGGGGTTAFEFRVSYAPEAAIRIVPQREDRILADIRELCAYWTAEARGQKRDRAIPFEMEKVYRNMAGLPPRGRDTDPIHAFVGSKTDVDALMFEISNRLNLSARTRTELLYREDRAPGQSEADWLQKRCDALNLGKVPDCPLPRRLDISLPNPSLIAEGFRFTLNDLRGIHTTDPRPDLHPDLVTAYSHPRALLVLCSNFLDAPDHCTQSVIEHLKARSAANESPLERNRVTLLVLPHADQAESVRRDDGDPVEDRGEGYDLKRRQIADRLGDTADLLAIEFFDARSDEPEPVQRHLLSRVLAIRSKKRQEIAHLKAAVENLISDIGQAHFLVTQHRVREKIERFMAGRNEGMDRAAVPSWLRLVRAIDRFYAASVWSVARGCGEGRSIDLYQVFAEFVREDAKERTIRPTTELKTLLRELLHEADMRRPEMARSESFVSEIVNMINSQHEAFLNKCNALALSSLKQALQPDITFWSSCAERWGQGSGFLRYVSHRLEQWFEENGKVAERLDGLLEATWTECFADWLRGYLSENADASRSS
jgi:transcriptional regulator with XRE-family HTH domain